MLPGEASQSRGASTSKSSIHKGVKSRTLMTDLCFPLIDQLSEKVKMNFSIVSVLGIYTLLQVIYTSFWGGVDQSFPIIQQIVFWDNDNYLILFFIFTSYIVTMFLLLIYQVISFSKTRKVHLIILYPLAFLFEYFAMVTMHPLCIYIGKMAYKLFMGQTSGEIIIISFFSLVYLIIIIAFYTFTSKIRQYSAYLDQTPLSSLDHQIVTLVIISSSILNIPRIILESFPELMLIFAIAIHVVIFAISLSKIYFFPFISSYMNIIGSTVLITCIILDIFRIFMMFIGIKIEAYMIYVITSVMLASLGIFVTIYYNIRQKKLKKLVLDENHNDNVTNMINARNFRYALYILHYSIEYMAPCFKDFSLPRLLIRSYTDDYKMAIKLLKVLILFPDKHRELQPLFEAIDSIKNLSIFDRFLAYQVIRIRALRQSSSSLQATSVFAQLRLYSKRCEETMISIWCAKDINSKNLYDYSKYIKTVRSMWEENIRNYPNNIIFHDEYSYFLIESVTDFKAAILEAHRSTMIEMGRNYSVDFCFRSFIVMFPMYLKKKIIDFKGVFINHGTKKNSTQSSNSNVSSTDSSTLDAKDEEEIGKTLVTQHKIRLSLQALTDSRKPNTFNIALFSIIFSFCFCLLMYILTFQIFFSYFDNRYNDTLRSITFNSCRAELSMINLLIILKWAEEIPEPRFIKDSFQFNDEITIESPSLIRGKDYSEMCIIHNQLARENYNEFLFDIADGSKRGENVFDMIPRLFGDLVDLTYCINGNPIDPPLKTDFKSALTYTYVVTKVLASKNTDITWFSNDRHMCNLFSNRKSFSDSFRLLRANHVMISF